MTPAIRTALGAATQEAHPVRLDEAIRFEPDLACFMPVQLAADDAGDLRAVPKPTNTSGDFVSLAGTDGFVELPRGRDHFAAGEAVQFFRW